MRFIGSRADPGGGASGPAPVSWGRAIDGGSAPDGGLWVPASIPRTFEGAPAAGEFGPWAAGRAMEWFDGPAAGDDLLGWRLPAAEIGHALDLPIRMRPLGPDIDLLDLTVGPTGAFKDVGARFLAALWAATPRADGRARMVLTATSGDTGGAVAAAVDGVTGLEAVVVFPLGRVSEVQRRQFTTRGANVRAVAVRGTFDDCQSLVREAFADPGLVEAHALVSANSINPGRLLPQCLYYGWLAGRAPGRAVVVPSGNLGNVTAAALAREMGADLGPIHAAVNANDALVRAARGADPRSGPAVRTDSTAMDVARPSNLERLRWLSSSTSTPLAELVNPASVPTEQARRAQQWAFRTHRVVLDPHTAVGVARALDLLEERPGDRPIVIETAHPAKFPEVVRDVLGVDPPPAPRLTGEGGGDGESGREERWATIDPDFRALVRVMTRAAIG